MEPIETIAIRGQQSFELHNQIYPIQITIDDDRTLNIFKKEHTKIYYKFKPMGIFSFG